MQSSTRLRYISAKDPNLLTLAITNLPFKIEIKSINVVKGRTFVYFVLPEDDNPIIDKFINVNLE